MSKGLETLERLKSKAIKSISGGMQTLQEKSINRECDIIKKELKAIEIIKDKKVDTYAIMIYANWELEDYNKVNYFKLTQEEYNLLKRCCYERI